MNKQVTLCSMAAIVLMLSPVTSETSASAAPCALNGDSNASVHDDRELQSASVEYFLYRMIQFCSLANLPGGIFNFEEPNISDGVLVEKERERVNMTFTVRDKNCSLVYSDISISKYEKAINAYLRQCIIPTASVERPAYEKMTCYCLESPGFCSFTFIADRGHNGNWKFSTGKRDTQEALVTFNITYPPRVTHLEVVGYDSYIPKHKFVTVVCSWENGNPPSMIRLVDRQNTADVDNFFDSQGKINDIIIAVSCCILFVFVLIITFLVTKGRVTRRGKREKTDTSKHSPRLSGVYYEIPDSHVETGMSVSEKLDIHNLHFPLEFV